MKNTLTYWELLLVLVPATCLAACSDPGGGRCFNAATGAPCILVPGTSTAASGAAAAGSPGAGTEAAVQGNVRYKGVPVTASQGDTARIWSLPESANGTFGATFGDGVQVDTVAQFARQVRSRGQVRGIYTRPTQGTTRVGTQFLRSLLTGMPSTSRLQYELFPGERLVPTDDQLEFVANGASGNSCGTSLGASAASSIPAMLTINWVRTALTPMYLGMCGDNTAAIDLWVNNARYRVPSSVYAPSPGPEVVQFQQDVHDQVARELGNGYLQSNAASVANEPGVDDGILAEINAISETTSRLVLNMLEMDEELLAPML